MEDKVKHVVVDAAGFIKNVSLQNIGEHIYTLPDVVMEIKDKVTRQRLQVLPYELIYREPSTECIKIVTDFARKTGDYRTLSAVDLRVLALSYQLEKEHVGVDHIKKEPDRNIKWETSRKHQENPAEIAGFYIGKKNNTGDSRLTSESQTSDYHPEDLTSGIENIKLQQEVEAKSCDSDSVPLDDTSENKEEARSSSNISESSEEKDNVLKPKDTTVQSDQPQTVEVEIVESEKPAGTANSSHEDDSADSPPTDRGVNEPLNEGAVLQGELLEEGDSDEDSGVDDDDEEDEDDDDGWITPGNIAAVKASMGDEGQGQREGVQVGCLTLDFAMQNVLIQMGLNVISVDGFLIKRAKSYVLRCFACMKVTTNLGKEFCPHCGNKTLQRVAMTVNENGSIRYFLSRRKAISTRGMKYSIPLPKGGKHSNNPILTEDQREAQHKMSGVSQQKYHVFDQDYLQLHQSTPFSPTDIHSRSALLGIRDFKHNFKRNPNESKKKTGRRK